VASPQHPFALESHAEDRVTEKEKETKPRTRRELEVENAVLRRINLQQGTSSVIRAVVKWGAIAFIALQARFGLEALAGQQTIADMSFKFLAEAGVSDVLAWLLAALGVLYGLAQRRMRRNLLERHGHRIPELERRLDAGRTSSELTERGETNQADRE
jgi:hypothetical protein